MATGYVHAVDVSNHQGVLSPAWVRCIRDTHNIRLAIHNVWNPTITRQNLIVFRDAGITTHLYVYLFENGGVEGDVQKVLRCVEGFDIPWVWLDVEGVRETAGWAPQQRIDHVQAVADRLDAEGFRLGIYTAAWYWRPYMADTRVFSHLPLWDATYNGVPEITPVSYGGWTQPVGRQYTSTAALCGMTVDANVFDPAILEEEDDMDILRDVNGNPMQFPVLARRDDGTLYWDQRELTPAQYIALNEQGLLGHPIYGMPEPVTWNTIRHEAVYGAGKVMKALEQHIREHPRLDTEHQHDGYAPAQHEHGLEGKAR